MAAKKTISTPSSIADRVVEELGPKILKLVKEHVKGAVEYAVQDGITGYCWEDDLSDSNMGWEMNQLIGQYLEEHLVTELKFVLTE